LPTLFSFGWYTIWYIIRWIFREYL